ncbi:induced myeloid leukemia cell differentiation protein Mcl-1b [Echeneis naucrates]|uniref:Induced myeloid leukemia cell differentiation protein Mcl-1 homolog n=1 Tax=Echeneis naucrates TaxID=173247 RepID=A0A665TFT7_ECHNA|nr:induced myeloid leukemia cell differentiation protein Mcl-1 homolog [Echeneis naucrates]
MSLFQTHKSSAFGSASTSMNLLICDPNVLPKMWTGGAGASSVDSPIRSDVAKRPTNLEVSSKGGCPPKIVRENSGGESVACTPESNSDSEAEASSPAERELLRADTCQLISQTMRWYTEWSTPRTKQHRGLDTMKRVVDGLLEKHGIAYNGMVNKLSLDNTEDMSFVCLVAQKLFSDGTTNWGRVASLAAFGVVVCRRLKEMGRESCVESVGMEISKYLLSEQKDWLLKNNSWDGFVEFFHVVDPESSVRNTLMAFAGVAGIGATLALLIR